jgi:hypothetical protein
LYHVPTSAESGNVSASSSSSSKKGKVGRRDVVAASKVSVSSLSTTIRPHPQSLKWLESTELAGTCFDNRNEDEAPSIRRQRELWEAWMLGARARHTAHSSASSAPRTTSVHLPQLHTTSTSLPFLPLCNMGTAAIFLISPHAPHFYTITRGPKHQELLQSITWLHVTTISLAPHSLQPIVSRAARAEDFVSADASLRRCSLFVTFELFVRGSIHLGTTSRRI